MIEIRGWDPDRRIGRSGNFLTGTVYSYDRSFKTRWAWIIAERHFIGSCPCSYETDERIAGRVGYDPGPVNGKGWRRFYVRAFGSLWLVRWWPNDPAIDGRPGR